MKSNASRFEIAIKTTQVAFRGRVVRRRDCQRMTRVRVGKSAVVACSERFFDQVPPLLDDMASQPEAKPPNNGASEWSEEKNARRAALIKQKYDRGLTSSTRRAGECLAMAVGERDFALAATECCGARLQSLTRLCPA